MQGSIATTFAVIATLAGMTGEPVTPVSYDAAYFDETSQLCGIYMEETYDGTYLAAYAAEGVEGEYVQRRRRC